MVDLLKFLASLAAFSHRIPRIRMKLLFVVLAGIVSGLAHAGLIALINTALARSGSPGALLGWAFASLCLSVAAFDFLSEAVWIRLVQRALFDFRLALCRRILSLPLRQLEELGPARILATLTGDVSAVTESLGVVPYLCTHLVMVLGCLLYLGWLSGTVLAGVLVFMAFGIVTYQLPIARGMRFRARAREASDALFDHLRGLTDGAKELKMNAPRRHAFLERQLERTSARLQRDDSIAYTIFAAGSTWGRVLFLLVTGLIIFVLPRFMAISPPVILGYCLTLIQMMAPLDGILATLPKLSYAAVAGKKVEQLGLSLEMSPREEDHGPKAVPSPEWNRLELQQITHSYRGEEGLSFKLGPIQLTFESGELVFLTGGNGSGKTTLAKLLLGLYTPESGEILLDGERIAEGNSDRYRQLFSTVFADFFIFRELVGLDASSGDHSALQYLDRLQLMGKVQIHDGVLSTTDLSQGQRKRLALLTAYLDDRPIYFFDEWAADQDPLFKEIFYCQLLPELKERGKTVFVISHDDRYFHVADRVIKLTNGRVEHDILTDRRAVPSAHPTTR